MVVPAPRKKANKIGGWKYARADRKTVQEPRGGEAGAMRDKVARQKKIGVVTARYRGGCWETEKGMNDRENPG